jgi:hypothetical protein
MAWDTVLASCALQEKQPDQRELVRVLIVPWPQLFAPKTLSGQAAPAPKRATVRQIVPSTHTMRQRHAHAKAALPALCTPARVRCRSMLASLVLQVARLSSARPVTAAPYALLASTRNLPVKGSAPYAPPAHIRPRPAKPHALSIHAPAEPSAREEDLLGPPSLRHAKNALLSALLAMAQLVALRRRASVIGPIALRRTNGCLAKKAADDYFASMIHRLRKI